MKTISLITFISSFLLIFAAEAKEQAFHCQINQQKSLVMQSVADTWKLELIFKDQKVASCPVIVTSLSEQLEQQSTRDIDFEIGACQYLLDKAKSEFSLVSKGFLKINEKQKRGSGLFLNNSQPIFCLIK